MKINPVLDKVVIKKCIFEEVYKSSIILTNNDKNNINKLIYEVIEVGPGGKINENTTVEMTVKPGDKVIIPEYIGSEIHIDGEDYRLVRMSDIIAIVENN